METQGICRLRGKKYTEKHKILLEITQENFETIKKLQPSFYTNLEIGYFITKGMKVFDSKGQPKSFSGREKAKFTFNKKKTHIIETFIEKYNYFVLQTQEAVDMLKSVGFSKAKIGMVFIPINSHNERVISFEEFTKKYEILEENLIKEK